MSNQAQPASTNLRVEVVMDNTIDLEKFKLRGPKGSSAEMFLYGRQVTSWKNEHGQDFLFMSSKATFKPPNPIRGGIAICFPEFSNMGSLDKHGFTSNKMWSIDPNPSFPPSKDNTVIDLLLKPTNEDMKIWPHSFELKLRVNVSCWIKEKWIQWSSHAKDARTIMRRRLTSRR